MILFLWDKFPEAESLDQRINIFLLLTYIVKTFQKCYKLHPPSNIEEHSIPRNLANSFTFPPV